MKDQKYDSTVASELLRLVEHSLWANREWIEFVYAQAEPETRPRELLCHVMVSERVWFERISGEQKIKSMFPVQTKEELLRDFDENRQTFQQLIPARLEEVIKFERGSGEKYHAQVLDIMHHLITHGYHHRGQLASHYARKGVKYPNTDHINYLIVNKL